MWLTMIVVASGPLLVSGDLPPAAVSHPEHTEISPDATDRARPVEPLGGVVPLTGAGTAVSTPPPATPAEALSATATVRPAEPAQPLGSGQ